MLKTRKKYKIKGWSKQSPNTKQRNVMMKKCGKKCFLGSKTSFPICTKNSCKVNKKGIYSAYIRAKEYASIKGTRKYKNIAKKALLMINKSPKQL